MNQTQPSRSTLTRVALVTLACVAAAGWWHTWAGAQSTGNNGPPPLTAEERENLQHATSLSKAFRTAAGRVLPAVVTIRTESRVEPVRDNGAPNQGIPDELMQDPFLRRFFEGMPRGMERGPRGPRQGMGSGVIIDPSGIILTNNHVVQDGAKVVVRLHDGREFEAQEVKADPQTDLAIVKIDGAGDLPYAHLGDSDKAEIGDWVIAVGAPFRLQESVTAGIISGKSRVIGINDREDYIQTDAAINPGNSGGPLVNLAGEIVGINTAISTTSGGYEGVGFAIPVNLAKWVAEQLRENGQVQRAYLGVLVREVNSQIASQLGLNEVQGALVVELQDGAPAAKAGVRVGDVILSYAGQPIRRPGDLQRNVERTAVGSKQALVVIRDGKEQTLQVEVQELPSQMTANSFGSGQSLELAELGIAVKNLDERTAAQLGLDNAEGVLVTEVQAGSLADRAGIPASCAILKVGRTSVSNVADLKAALGSLSLREGVVLTIRTEEGSRIVYLSQQ